MDLSNETIQDLFFEKARSSTARVCKAPASFSQHEDIVEWSDIEWRSIKSDLDIMELF